MHIIVYNIYGSRLHMAVEATCLKIGFIIGGMAVSAGSIGFDTFIAKNIATLNFKQKLKFLESIPGNSEQNIEIVQQAREILHLHNKIKHKTQAQIVSFKKIEQSVTAFCEASLEDARQIFDTAGFTPLSELRSPSFFGYYHVPYDGETADNDMYIPASTLLNLDGVGETEYSNLFFLPFEFFSTEFKETVEAYKNATGMEGDKANFYLEPFFSMPNINFLTAEELKLLRNGLQAEGMPLRTQMVEWMKLCFENAGMQQRRDYFYNNVVSSATALGEAMKQNNIIAHCNTMQQEAAKMEIYAGEIPVHLLWDFYRHYKVIQDGTWDILQQLKEEGFPSCKSWPVMVLYYPEDAVQAPVLEEESLPMKKYIAVD